MLECLDLTTGDAETAGLLEVVGIQRVVRVCLVLPYHVDVNLHLCPRAGKELEELVVDEGCADPHGVETAGRVALLDGAAAPYGAAAPPLAIVKIQTA